MRLRLIALALASVLASSRLDAQESIEVSRKPRFPISIGNYPNVNGLRINFRDENLGRVNGMNVTVWAPYEPLSGVVKGIALGLPATGAARIEGLGLGVFGLGASDRLSGVMLAPVGVGAGGHVKGIAVGGIGVGTGGKIRGVAIAGIGVGAPRLEGGFAALAVGAREAEAVVIAPAYFKIEKGGSFRGGSASAINDIRGTQTGMTIGLLNYARSVNGVQIGVINVIADQREHRVLPLINWGVR